MADYNAQLIDLLNEKIQRLRHEKAELKREVNRLKKKIKELERAKDETI